MSCLVKVIPLCIAVAATACFRNTVQTGLTPSNDYVVVSKWAPSWLGGMFESHAKVQPGQCPNGVATVDTGLSFWNWVVSYLTAFIYTPETIVVTCAAPSSERRDGTKSQPPRPPGAHGVSIE